MHHGHRGINHPVLNLETGKSEVTSQNHGFGVALSEEESQSLGLSLSHINLNDQTVEGIRHSNRSVFSIPVSS